MVERVLSKRRRIMRDFVIKELSAVDRPAQSGAVMTIMKRAPADAGVGKVLRKTASASGHTHTYDDSRSGVTSTDMDHNHAVILKADGSVEIGPGGSDGHTHAPAAVNKAVDISGTYGYNPTVVAQEIEALSFDEVLSEQAAREAACQVNDNIWARWHALCRSFETIAADDDVSPADKISSMQESLQQFIASLQEQSDVIAETMTKSLRAVPALAGLLAKTSTEGEVHMTAAEKQQLAELQKRVAELTKAAGGEGAKDAKKAAEIQAAIAEVTKELETLTKSLEAADAERAELVAKAGMSDAEKEHYEGLDKADKPAFLAMTPEERKKKMKKSADDNPVVYKSERTGEEFRKSDDPRIVKYAKQADEDAEVARAERTKRENAELTKRADDELKVFSDDIAKRDVKIEVLRGIDKMDEGPRTALLKMLEVGGKAITAAFSKIGHSQETAAKSAGDFNKRVSDIMARDKVTKLVAMEKAEREYPEEFKAYQDSGAVLSN